MSKTRGRMSGWLASFVSVACLLSACDAHTPSDATIPEIDEEKST